MPGKRPNPRNVTPRPFKKDPGTLRVLDTAYKLHKAGSLDQAELLYHKVLAAEPGNPFAIYALGTIALHRGEFANAATLLRQALDAGYVHETVFTHLGIALQASEQGEQALEIYRAGMKHDPRNARYHSNSAVVLAQRGDHEGALAEAMTALKLHPKFSGAAMNAGFCLQSLNRLPEAAAMFERTLKLDPNNGAVRDALKALKRKLENPDA